MARLDYWLDDDDVRDAQQTFLFAIPGDAFSRGSFDDPTDEKARAAWVQKFVISEVKMYEDVTKEDSSGNSYPCLVFEVAFQVPPDAVRPKTGEADPNAGREHRAWYRIVPAAKKSPQHAKFKANRFFNGKLTSIVRAIWGSTAFPPGQGINLGDFYGTDVLLGKGLMANMEASKYEGKPKNEIADFVPAEMAGA